MAIIVEDGTVVTDSNSYVSVADADAYLDSSLSRAEWAILADDEKERLLIAASRWLDQQARWNGCKQVETGSMRWPRDGVYDADGILIPVSTIPEQLRDAVCELAAFFSDPENNPLRYSDSQGLEEITVDVINLRYAEGYDQSARRFLPGINTLLQGLGAVRTARGRGHAPIVRS